MTLQEQLTTGLQIYSAALIGRGREESSLTSSLLKPRLLWIHTNMKMKNWVSTYINFNNKQRDTCRVGSCIVKWHLACSNSFEKCTMIADQNINSSPKFSI